MDKRNQKIYLPFFILVAFISMLFINLTSVKADSLSSKQAHITVYMEPTTQSRKGQFNNMQRIETVDAYLNNDNQAVIYYRKDFPNNLVSNDEHISPTASFTFNLPSGMSNYVLDPTFSKQVDPDRLGTSYPDHQQIIKISSNGKSATFNFNNLPTNGRLNNNAYQIFVKPKNQKSFVVKPLHKNSYEGILNWFNDHGGKYIGTTVVDDYSMGITGRRENWYIKHYRIPKHNLKNVLQTQYTLKNQGNWRFAYDEREYGKNGFVTANSNLTTAIYSADNNSKNGAFLSNSPDANGKNFHIYRLFLKAPNNDENYGAGAPTIISKKGYTNTRKIPYFVEFWDVNKHKLMGVSALLGKKGKRYSIRKYIKLPKGYKYPSWVKKSYKIPNSYVFNKAGYFKNHVPVVRK